jgi:hypothetical protein
MLGANRLPFCGRGNVRPMGPSVNVQTVVVNYLAAAIRCSTESLLV